MFAKLVNTDNYENRCMIKENIERCYENNKSCFENSQIHPIGVLKHHQCFRTPKVGCVTAVVCGQTATYLTVAGQHQGRD